jgi:hypothetical protein
MLSPESNTHQEFRSRRFVETQRGYAEFLKSA